MRDILKLIAPVLMSGTLIACGAPKSITGAESDGLSLGATETPGFKAFKTGYWQWAKTNCATCHAGGVNSPFFAHPDAKTAYNAANTAPYFNVNDPDNSELVTYVANAHCGTSTKCSNTAALPDVKTMVEAWAAAELTPSPNPSPSPGPSPGPTTKYKTVEVAIPTPLPNLTAAPKVIRWQLSSLSPSFAALSGAVLEFEIQLANPTTYRLTRPKIAGNTAAVAVKGIHVYVKPSGTAGGGVEDKGQGMGWVTLQATAASSGLPNPLPAGPMPTVQPLTTIGIAIQQQSPTDVLIVGIESLN